MTHTCTFCSSDLEPYDPIAVYETRGRDEVPAGRFCNYACLAEHIDEQNLTDGACCFIDPGAERG